MVFSAAARSFGKSTTRTFGKVVPEIVEGVGGAIKNADPNAVKYAQISGQPIRSARLGAIDTPKIMGDYSYSKSAQYTDDVIAAQNRARNSPTNSSNQIFIGNRHPDLSPGVEDFTGLDIPEGAVEWMTTGKAALLREKFLKAKGSTKANPKYITFQELVAQWEAAPKGSKKNALKAKIDGYKSLMATPWAKDAEDIIRYQMGNEPAITAELKTTRPELFSPQLHQSTEFHHWSLKEVDGAFFEHAEDLVRRNKATVIDLINLHNLNKHYGIESGSRIGAALPMQRGPHNWMHKARTIQLGYEPRTTPEPSGLYQKLAKMRNPPPKFKKIFSSAEWQKIRKSGATTTYDLEEIAAFKANLGIDGSINRFKKRLAQGKTYTPDGKSEMTRLIEEFKSIDNIAELTEWRKSYIESTVLPMKEEALLTESFAKEMSPEDLARSTQWAQEGMGEQLESLRLNKKRRNFEEYQYKMERWRDGKGPYPGDQVPPDPEFEERIGDYG